MVWLRDFNDLFQPDQFHDSNTGNKQTYNCNWKKCSKTSEGWLTVKGQWAITSPVLSLFRTPMQLWLAIGCVAVKLISSLYSTQTRDWKSCQTTSQRLKQILLLSFLCSTVSQKLQQLFFPVSADCCLWDTDKGLVGSVAEGLCYGTFECF